MLKIHLLPIPLRFPEEVLTIKETITIINAVYIWGRERAKPPGRGGPELRKRGMKKINAGGKGLAR
jgi:hypothetical protein